MDMKIDAIRRPSGCWLANCKISEIISKYGASWSILYETGVPVRTKTFDADKLIDLGYVGVYIRSEPDVEPQD